MASDAPGELFAPPGGEAAAMSAALREVEASAREVFSGRVSVELVTSPARAARVRRTRRLPVWDPDEFQVRVSASLPEVPGAEMAMSHRFVVLPAGLSPAQLEVYRVLRRDGVERLRAVGLASGAV